jgi:hypothetical protein
LRARVSIAIAGAVLATASVLGLAIGASPDGGAVAPGETGEAAPKRNDANVRIVFTVIPSSKRATVSWGKKKLGQIAPQHPLIITRPRDSGPLDVMVRAEGCLPVQTRAYTFADSKVAVKVTPLDQKNTLLGYREELPPDGGAPSPDGGVR